VICNACENWVTNWSRKEIERIITFFSLPSILAEVLGLDVAGLALAQLRAEMLRGLSSSFTSSTVALCNFFFGGPDFVHCVLGAVFEESMSTNQMNNQH
jgi:hypothetical protein